MRDVLAVEAAEVFSLHAGGRGFDPQLRQSLFNWIVFLSYYTDDDDIYVGLTPISSPLTQAWVALNCS